MTSLEKTAFLIDEPSHKMDIDVVIEELSNLKSTLSDAPLERSKMRASKRFWKSLLQDIQMYEKEINNKSPFSKTCYKNCPRCVQWYDAAYYEFKIVGYRRRQTPKIYKEPLKSLTLLAVFVGGIFKILRANQDGAASFYGALFTLISQMTTFIILISDSQYLLAIPKVAGAIVALGILIGIIQNAGENGIGL